MSKILKGLNEVNPHNYDSDWDYQNAVASSGRSRSSYRSQEDDTFDDDVAYSKKMYQLSQKQKRDADHDRLATGTNEGIDDPWGDQGNFAGDKPVNLGGVSIKNIQTGDTVKYFGQPSKVVAMSKDRKYSRITISKGIGEVTQDVLTSDLQQLGQGVSEEQLDEISNEKLSQYKTAAALDAGKADLAGDYKKADKRFSGIVKATKKQFANDTKTVKEDINVVYKKAKSLITQLDENTQQRVINALTKNIDDEEQKTFKSTYPRVNNPQILGTKNRAKSAYYPPSKPNVKKLDKPLPESLGDELKSKSLEALQQVKQQLEQQRIADLEQWEKDFKQNTVSKFTAREPNFRQRATSTPMVAMPGEKHSELKARLSQLDKAIEKQGILDNLVQKLDKKGLLTPNIEAGVDTSMLARDGARDNYVELNRKLDKALEYVKNRLLTNKAAYAKPKGVDEGWSQKYKSSINCSHPKGFSQKAHCAGKKKHNESIEMEMVCEDCGMCETHVDHTNLDEACWKGYHKEGNKKMFGKTYPNCVKNTNEEQLDEKCWDTHKQVGMKSKGGKQVPNCVPKESVEEGEVIPMQPRNPLNKNLIIQLKALSETALEIFWEGSYVPTAAQGQMAQLSQQEQTKIFNQNVAQFKALGYETSIFEDDMDILFLHSIAREAWYDSKKPMSKYRGLPDLEYNSDTNSLKIIDLIGDDDEGIVYDKNVYEQDITEEKCPHCNGPMFSEMIMNEKKDACYYKVKSRYKVWPSAYASGALVKCRKKGASNWGNGGKKNESSILEGIEQADESLHDWFNKEKWVRMDTKGNIKGPCAREPGEGKPKCLPQAKAHSLGKKGRASAAQRKRREDPNPERSGKAINVNTKKNSNENVDENWKQKLGAAALTGAMALGAAGANARVTPGDDPNINRLTGKPNITQPVQTQTPTKAEAPKGFSKEYLQSVVNGTHPRPMISVEKAQELLKQGQ